MEISKIYREDDGQNIKTTEIMLRFLNKAAIKYQVKYFIKGNDLYASRKDMKDDILMTYTPCWLKFDDVLDISYDDFMLKNMSGELGNSLQELDVYYNLYLFLIGRITEQDLRNEIVKLFK